MVNVESILKLGETQSVEFKKSMSQMKDGCKSLCAMLNTAEGSGMVIFGISPDNKVAGLNDDNLDSAQKSLAQHIQDKFDPSVLVSIKVSKYKEKNILILSAERPKKTRYYEYDGRAFIKEGSTKRTLKIQEKEMLNLNDYDSNILEMQEEDLERTIYNVLKQKNNFVEINFLKNTFNHISSSITEAENDSSDLIILPYYKKIFTLWKILIEYDAVDFAKMLVDFMHKLYVDVYAGLDFNKLIDESEVLKAQSRIVFIVYCMGAYSIQIDKPRFAELLIGRTNPFLENDSRLGFAEDSSWFLYILLKLSENKCLIRASLCQTILDFLEKNKIFFNEFNNVENISDRLCQFDYFQCINEIISKVILGKEKNINIVCFPSFGNSYMRRTESFIEKIINTYEQEKWIPKVSSTQLVLAINTLHDHVKRSFDNFFWPPWDREFSSRIIKGFLEQ